MNVAKVLRQMETAATEGINIPDCILDGMADVVWEDKADQLLNLKRAGKALPMKGFTTSEWIKFKELKEKIINNRPEKPVDKDDGYW